MFIFPLTMKLPDALRVMAWACVVGASLPVGAAPCVISDSYSRAAILSTSGSSGGLVGDASAASITRCYVAGTVLNPTAETAGIAGSTASAKPTSTYWDQETSGITTGTDGVPRSTAVLTGGAKFFTGWDFLTIWADDRETNDSYPTLRSRSSVESTQVPIFVTASPAEGGSVTGGGNFRVGAAITLTAAPSARFSFVGWREGQRTIGKTTNLAHQVQKSRSFEAVFRPNPVPAGMFFSATLASPVGPGLVTLQSASSNVFSGVWTTANGSVRFRGKFSEAASPEVRVQLGSQATLLLQYDHATGKITSTYEKSGSTATAFRLASAAHVGKSVSPLSGRWLNVILEPSGGVDSTTPGIGFAQVKFASLGQGTLVANLPHGKKLLGSVRTLQTDTDGKSQMDVGLFDFGKSQTCLVGEISLVESGGSIQATGSLDAHADADTKRKPFPEALDWTLTVWGSVWKPPGKMNLITLASSASPFQLRLDIGGSVLASTYTQNATCPPSNKPTLENSPTGMKMTFNPASGTFQGRFPLGSSDGTRSTPISFSGVLLEKVLSTGDGDRLHGAGFFCTSTKSAAVEVTSDP